MSSGAYRQVPEGTPGAEWAEGAGWIIYDEQALRETQEAARRIAIGQWKGEEREALARLERARAELSRLER